MQTEINTYRLYRYKNTCPDCGQVCQEYRRVIQSEAGEFTSHNTIRECSNPDCGRCIIPNPEIWRKTDENWEPVKVVARVSCGMGAIPQANNNFNHRRKVEKGEW